MASGYKLEDIPGMEPVTAHELTRLGIKYDVAMLEGLLGGGIEAQAITEFEARKTQLCRSLYVWVATFPREMRAGRRRALIDSEGNGIKPTVVNSLTSHFRDDSN